MSNQAINQAPSAKPSGMDRFLNFIERAGNKIPDPAILFFWALVIVWVSSALLSNVSFDLTNPRTNEALEIKNLLTKRITGSFSGQYGDHIYQFCAIGHCSCRYARGWRG
ncbi:AbgT family transporter [Vibrio cholerae]